MVKGHRHARRYLRILQDIGTKTFVPSPIGDFYIILFQGNTLQISHNLIMRRESLREEICFKLACMLRLDLRKIDLHLESARG